MPRSHLIDWQCMSALVLRTMKKNMMDNKAAPGKRKRLAPADMRKLVAAGRILLSNGETGELIRQCNDGLRQVPGHPDLVHLQFLGLTEEKRYAEAIRFLQKWGKHPAGRNIRTQHIIGYSYFLIKRFKTANRHLANVLAVKPDMHVARLLMSRAFSDAGHQGPGLKALREGPATASMRPKDAINYATVLHRLEQYSSAKSVLEEPLKAGSMKAECAYELIRLPAETWSPETCSLVEELLQGTKLNERQKNMLRFSAGRIADHQGRYDDALCCFAKGKQLATQEFDFDVLERAVAACTSRPGPPAGSLPARNKQGQTVTPVFILGLPRSGKTTLENLLARRREIAACGEVTPRMFVDEDIFIGAQGQLPSNYADRLTSMKSTQRDMYARRYTEQICEQFFLPESTRYIINTMPHNFLNIATLHKIFPTSKFIYIQRNSRDLFTFCFMKNFKNEYNFTGDFGSFIRYHNLFDDVISCWQDALGPNFTTVSYEDMVRSPEAMVDRLHGFLGVDLSAEEASEANAAMVNLTDQYVGHWKNYERLFSQTDTPAP